MKENVLDVLIYLFDNYMDDETEWEPDWENLAVELEQAGFRDGEISKAFEWLDGLAAQRADVMRVGDPVESAGSQAVRIFAPQELERLDRECLGFLMYLEQNGILSPAHREVVIDRIMALDDEIDLEQVKWVVLMVLFNMPGQEATYAWVEDLVFENYAGLVH